MTLKVADIWHKIHHSHFLDNSHQSTMKDQHSPRGVPVSHHKGSTADPSQSDSLGEFHQ